MRPREGYTDEELLRELKAILYLGCEKDDPELWEILDELRDREADDVNAELEKEAHDED